MSILQSSIVPASAGGYEIANSLRFNDDDSAYLSRTPASAGNRKTWTWSAWVKLGNVPSGTSFLFSAGAYSSTELVQLVLDQYDISFEGYNTSPSRTFGLLTTAEYRDPSAWYHIVASVDTTQATASNRVKLYVNGSQVTDLTTEEYPTQNYDTATNSTIVHTFGNRSGTSLYFDGYMAEVNFIDGQALDPSNFGETGDYGEWKPIKYTGTYGTNGFYLDFENSGSLGADASSNSNNWTPNNLAATDQMLDSPTNNFCTFSPIHKGTQATLSEGNTKYTLNTLFPSQACTSSTMGITSGKWYCEMSVVVSSGNHFGVLTNDTRLDTLGYLGQSTDSYGYAQSGTKYNGGSQGAYGATYTTGDVIGVALDADAGTLEFYKNNVSQGVAFTGMNSDTYFMATGDGDSTIYHSAIINAGQDSSFAGNKTAQGNSDGNGIGDFYYSPPTGYLALCTQNLPDPAVIPSEHFNTVLYTGNGSTQSITGVGFQPEWLWIKNRTTAGNGHVVQDVVRGSFGNGDHKVLITNNTNAEYTQAGFNDLYGSVTSLDADGFTVDDGSSPTYDSINGSGQNYVSWNWKANGAGVSNTDGSITSTVSANVDAGFSIVSYTGTGANATVGHGLSKAPEMVIQKNRIDAQPWWVYIKALGAGKELRLNDTTAEASDGATLWNSTPPSTTVFSLGDNGGSNGLGDASIAYCFHSVDGYSKVGSYTGNGSTDGTFVHTGFRPAYVMVKRTDSTSDWFLHDGERSGGNGIEEELWANVSDAENTTSPPRFDFTSNGFKLRNVGTGVNASGATYIFLAFAETDFKHSNAR